jgi:hypothetical protein
MTNIEKMRAAIKARDEAFAAISRLERETGLDREFADLSDDKIRSIRDYNRDIYMSLPAGGSMSLEKSAYLQMRKELIARGA